MGEGLMNLSVRQLRAFVATARLRSFTRAAEQLHMTQPGLSGMLRELETQLDCTLFERTTRSVTPTVQGEAFLPTAVRVLRELEEASLSLGHITATQRRRLSVGATPVLASSVFPAACAAFAERHPAVRVEVQDLDRGAIYEKVQNGELDAGFGAFLTASSTVKRRKLLSSPLVLVCAVGRAAGSVRWKDVARETMIGLPPGNPIQQLVDSHLRGSAVSSLGEPQSFNHLHTLLAMVEAGMGLTILPHFVAGAASRYSVCLRELSAPRVAVDFYEITKAGRKGNELLAEFGNCLVAALASQRHDDQD
jgi:DNA-binding transcriptional LysR family regulator